MKARALTVRAIALLAAGSAAIHQLRYAIGYGNDAGHALAAQGHAYFDVLLPFLVALAVVALASMLRAAPLAGTAPARPSLRRSWLVTSCALAGAYFAQELIEGILAAGHPAGVAGVFGADGWVALVLAAPVGLLVALGVRGGEALTPGRQTRLRPPPLASPPLVLGCASAPQARRGIARLLPARGPPLLSVR